MKYAKIIALALVVMAVPLLLLVGTSYAGDFRSGDNAIVGKNESVDHTLFITGNNVEIDGEVNGDVFCAGQNVTINAKVDGDVICAGMNVKVGGTVNGDVRLAGQVVTLTGTIARNASLAGATVTIDDSSLVKGDLYTTSSVATVNGMVGRDASIYGDSVTLNNVVGRNVSATTKNLRLGDHASVAGELTYYSYNSLIQSDSARVAGKVTRQEPQSAQRPTNPIRSMIAGKSMFLLTFAILALAVTALLPRMLQSVTEHAISNPATTVMIGLGACLAVPALIIVSMFTVVGVVLGITLLLIWLIIMLLSGVFFSYYLGRLVFTRSPQHPLLTVGVGVLITWLLMLIPIVNILTCIAVVLFGSGMAIRELFARTPKPLYTVVKKTAKLKK